MSEIDLEELEDIKDQAFLEGVVGALTRVSFLIDNEKDPAVAIKKLREEIDRTGKQACGIFAARCNQKILKKIGYA